jgi:hypothetical protein
VSRIRSIAMLKNLDFEFVALICKIFFKCRPMDASKAETSEKGGSVHNTLAVNDNVRDFVTFSETGEISYKIASVIGSGTRQCCVASTVFDS